MFNKFDKNSEAYKSGMEAENQFKLTAEFNGYVAEKSSKYQDCFEHIDYFITKDNIKTSVEVKSQKRLSRKDTKGQSEWIWIEFKNVNGNKGWVYGKADKLAFETDFNFILVDREDLAKLAEKLIDQGDIVRNSKDAKYKCYRRSNRPNELVGMIHFDDLKKLKHEKLKKNLKIPIFNWKDKEVEMYNYKYIIGCDPGLKGGLSILDNTKKEIVVKRIPTKKVVVNKKDKEEYDLKEIVDLLKPYSSEKTFFLLERVSVRPLEGSVSSFGFGRSSGQLEGIAVALGFDLEKVSPVSWKNHFKDLHSKEFLKIKEEIDKLKESNKKKEDKSIKNEIKKLMNKLKTQTKDDARSLCVRKHPTLEKEFELKRDDGKAESLLIALYAFDNFLKKVDKSNIDKELENKLK